MTTARSRAPRMPAGAQDLRRPLWERSRHRARDRFGIDVDSPHALDEAHAFARANPDNADIALLLASLLSLRGQLDAALAEARRATELDPGSARAHTTLATLLMHGGDADAALTHARRAAEADGDDPLVLHNLALAEWVAGDRRRARVALADARQRLGLPPVPWWRRGGRA